jgi:hypothetical protein
MRPTPRRLGTLVVLGALALSTACSSAPTADASRVVSADGLTATLVPGGVQLANDTDHGVAFVVHNPNWLGLLALCADPGPNCVRLAAGGRMTVPQSQFAGWDEQPAADRKLSVLWWRVVPAANGGYAAVDVRELALIP